MGAATTVPASPRSRSSAPPGRLPPAVLYEAASRIAWLCLAVAIVLPVFQLAQWRMQHELYVTLMNGVNIVLSIVTVLAAGGIFWLHRSRRASASTVLQLGAGLQVVGAFAIAMMETALPIQPDRPVLGISKLGPWIVGFGAFSPDRPRWTLITASVTAAMWPLAYFINSTRFGFPPVPLGLLSVWPLFNALMVALTYFISRQTHRMALAAESAVALGSYRLTCQIGAGGMGEVWKATHQMLARSAAIKLMKADGAPASLRHTEVAIRRFQREADAIARLQSPHTVYLYDFGVSDDGRFYYVMELLDGISLQSLVSNFGPQPAARVVPMLKQICRSLAEAHLNGVVHRDLKPSNVMLCSYALTYDFIKVLDFGLAKIVGRDAETQVTMEGIATGTPGYIAPEIALGEHAIDGRADIYALGCLGYFLLTGTLVFSDPNPMTMVLKHVRDVPDPPSSRTELPIPAELERVILQCLAKAPADRPPTAADVLDMLEACQIPAWSSAQIEAWWQTNLPATSSLRSFAQPAARTPAMVRKA